MKNKLIKLFIFITLVLCVLPVRIHAENGYTLYDFTSDTAIGENYSVFNEVVQAYQKEKDNYNNLGIVQGDKVIVVEYGVANFNRGQNCDVAIEFVNQANGLKNHIGGCYIGDGAYIGTNLKDNTATIKVAGVVGKFNVNDVEIVPLEQIKTSLSNYIVKNGVLYHQIKTSLHDDNYAYIIPMDQAPSYLEENTKYYSYDGHYFYREDALGQMIEDYLNDGNHSVNQQDPYFNYYQFLPQRSQTNISYEALHNQFIEQAGMTGDMNYFVDDDFDGKNDVLTRSQYYGTLSYFYTYQSIFGVNALTSFATSQVDSNSSRSLLSYTKNNLFSQAAFDNDAEKDLMRYNSVSSSIYAFDKYIISGSYASPLKRMFHGSFLGNKNSGMNVEYSLDPYWGEKVASSYFLIDRQNEWLDRNNYTLGIKTNHRIVNIYQKADQTSKILYSTTENSDFSMIILGEENEFYKIQSESTLNDQNDVALEYQYDFENDIGYVLKSDIDIVMSGKNQYPTQYVSIKVMTDGGQTPGGFDQANYKVPVNTTIYPIEITKDNALFVGYDQSTEKVSQDTEFHATYKDVQQIEISVLPTKLQYFLFDTLDLRGGELKVLFQDGSSKTYPLTTSMALSSSFQQTGKQSIQVRFAGMTTSFDVDVIQEKTDSFGILRNNILQMLQQYQNTKVIDSAVLDNYKKTIIEDGLPDLSIGQYRQFDQLFYDNYQTKYKVVLDKNPYDLQVSGLTTTLPSGDEKSATFRIDYHNNVSSSLKRQVKNFAQYNNLTVIDEFRFTLTKNFFTYDLNNPLIYSLKLENPENDYSVLYYDESTKDLQECYSRQTQSRIVFMSKGNGSYILVAKQSNNHYQNPDITEVITSENDYFDWQSLLLKTSLSLFGILLVGGISYLVLKHKSHIKQLARRIKREKSEEHSPVDITDTMILFQTQVLDINKLKQFEQEQEKLAQDTNDSSSEQEEEVSVEEENLPQEDDEQTVEMDDEDDYIDDGAW